MGYGFLVSATCSVPSSDLSSSIPIDIGQLNMYMGYFAKEENMADDNPPIGIILSHNKDELLVEYATYGMDSNLFVSKYELYLPNRNELQKLVNNILEKDTEKKEE